MVNDPTYPANPYTMCPRLRLRLRSEQISPGKYSGSANVALNCTLWYYRRQVVGEAHQVMLLQDLETIITPLFGVWRPAPMTNTVSGGLYTVRSANSTIHDEMRHEFDDPNLRVSVASIALTIEGSVMVQNS